MESSRGVPVDGSRCKELRKKLGLTQEQLAESSRGPQVLSLATIKRAERGSSLDLTTVQRLAYLLGAKVEDIVAGQRKASPAVPPRGDDVGCAIAVLPFRYLGEPTAAPEVASNWLADGLTDDLICRLGGWFFPVISSASVFRLGDDAGAPGSSRSRLAARYIVSGSVARDPRRIRVSVRLEDGVDGTVLWAGQLEHEAADVLRVSDDLGQTMVAKIAGCVLQAESTRAFCAHESSDLDTWQLSMRGAWHYYRGTRVDNELARPLLRDALDRDPTLRCARYWLAMTHQQELSNHWSATPSAVLDELRRCTDEFRKWYPHDPFMNTVAGYSAVYSGQREVAKNALSEAIASNRNLASARSLYGQVLAMDGCSQEAIEHLEVAMRLSPLDPKLHTFQAGLALAHFVEADYERMRVWAERSLHCAPSAMGQAAYACALAYLGDRSGAQHALAPFLASSTASRTLALMIASTRSEIAERFAHGLTLAGLPNR